MNHCKTHHRLRLLFVSLVFSFVAVAAGCNNTTAPDEERKGEIKIEGTQVELKGFIESKGTLSLVVYGHIVAITGNTRIENESEQQIGFDDLIVGTFVEIHGTLQPDSSIVADEIAVETRDDGRS